MSPELMFQICNNAVLPAWLLILVAPAWRWTERIVYSIWIPCLLAVAYAFALGSGTAGGDGSAEGGFSSLAGVMALFTNPWAMLGGWIHYLAFDLFVGAWEARDAVRRGIHPLLVAPCLVLTLMLGPVGLGLYLVLRAVLKRETGLVEAAAPA